MTAMLTARLLAIDWGTSAARAYWLGAQGVILERRDAPLGIQKIGEGTFADSLTELCGGTVPESLPILACGMIGSRQGWIEAPYRECPAPFDVIGAALTKVPDVGMWIVPGLFCRD